MKTLETEILIEASTEKVWQVLTDFENYSQWNPFIRSISGKKMEGEKLKVFLKPPNSKGMVFHPRIKKFNPGNEFRWKGKLGLAGIFDGEHYFILEEMGAGRTRFIHGENFSGLLVPFMEKILDNTKKGFSMMNLELKKQCERQKKKVKPAKIIKKGHGTRSGNS